MKKADLGIAAYLLLCGYFLYYTNSEHLIRCYADGQHFHRIDHPVQCTVCTGNLRDVIFPNVIAVYHTVQNFSERIFHTSDPDNRRSG